jgi:hypothetical protein
MQVNGGKSAFVAHARAGRVGALQVTNHALRRSQRMRQTWLWLANQPITRYMYLLWASTVGFTMPPSFPTAPRSALPHRRPRHSRPASTPFPHRIRQRDAIPARSPRPSPRDPATQCHSRPPSTPFPIVAHSPCPTVNDFTWPRLPTPRPPQPSSCRHPALPPSFEIAFVFPRIHAHRDVRTSPRLSC